MVKIKSGQQGEIKWSILKTACNEKEDFSKAVMCVFLIGNDNKIPYKPKQITLQTADDDEEHAITGEIPESASVLEYEVINNVIVAQIPTTLSDGVYGVEAIWYKDNLCKKTYAKVSNVFMVTDEAQVYAGNAVIRITSKAATYGYDGIDSYELAVLLGKTSLDRNSWVGNVSDMNSLLKSAVDTAKEKAELAEQQAKAAQAAAETASKFVNPSGITIDNETYIMTFNGQQYLLTPYVRKPWKEPEEQKVVDEIIYGTPVITDLTYETMLPAAGGTIKTASFHFSQTKTTTYKSNHASDFETFHDDSNAVVEWEEAAKGSADGSFTIEPNKSGENYKYVVNVRVTINGATSEWKEVELIQPSMTPVSTVYKNLKLDLVYQEAEASGGTVFPTSFTYTVDKTTKYNVEGCDDVEALSGKVNVSDIEYWENTNNRGASALSVSASTLDYRHEVKKVKAYVNMFGIKDEEGHLPFAECTVYQKAYEVKGTGTYVYNNVNCAVTYSKVPATGGTATPSIIYCYDKREVMSDGTTRLVETIWNTGGIFEFSGLGVAADGKVTHSGASASETDTELGSVTVIVRAPSPSSETAWVDEVVKIYQLGVGKQQEFMYVGASASLPTTNTEVEAGLKKDVEDSPVSVTTDRSDKKKCHYVAIKTDSQYRVTKVVDIDNDEFTDRLTTSTVGSYTLYAYVSSAYISMTSKFTISK